PLVVAGPLARIPGRRIARAVIEQVQLRIVRDPAPGAPAADLPLIALPSLYARVLADRLAELGGLGRVDFFQGFGAPREGSPCPLAGLQVVSGHMELHAELA